MKYIFGMSILLTFLFNACKKDDSPKHIGEVKNQTNDCTSSNGFPFLIKVYDTPLYDSFFTTSLPKEYWKVGEEINFRVREHTSNDAFINWNTNIAKPKFYIVYDVSNY